MVMFTGMQAAMAQEHSFGKEEYEHHNHSELNTHLTTESDVIGLKSNHSDTLSFYRPAIPRPKPKLSEARNHDEEALKFNFLYIIIQKFKFSDIID